MLQLRKADERGHADHGWLNAYHSFSFAGYHDPDHMGFGPLRVLNQDRVAKGKGFGTHPHHDMEIVTYVLDGVLEHKDSMGNGSRMRNGEVQFMSAGHGVEHSEFNPSNEEELHLLQMWILPRRKGTEPRYEQKSFSEKERAGSLRLVVSPDGADGSVTIGQETRMYAGLFSAGDEAHHEFGGRAGWLHLAKGTLKVNDTQLGPGDGLAIQDEAMITIQGTGDAEFVLWEFPANL